MTDNMTTDNMSNEEVIETLKGIVFNGFDRTTRKERQALDLAIKALEERPQDCSDCKRYDFPYFEVKFDKEQMQELVDKAKAEVLASIERPQGEWKRHDEWRSGEYIGGFYHVNCPCEDGYYSKWETNFCPNCGLPMKKGGAE